MTNTDVDTRPAQDTDTNSGDRATSPDAKETLTLGLVPSPGLPEEVARDISEDLPELLAEHVDNTVEWEVSVEPDPLTGTDVGTEDLLTELVGMAEHRVWAYTISMTDLPVRHGGKIVVANLSRSCDAGWISIPSFGPFSLRRRAREMVTQIVHDLHSDPDGAKDSEQLIGSNIARRDQASDEREDVDTRYIAPGFLSRVRLLGGMFYANEPWTIFGSFKTTIATAVATASYALIFTSVWEFGAAYSYARLIVLTFLAMGFLGAWIIISHRLWQEQFGVSAQFVTSMYNATTIVTVASGVIFAYVLIYIVLLIEAVAFMPPSILESRLKLPVGPLIFAKSAWVAATIGTLAGAIGAGLEDTEKVRRATFGWRQRRRYEEYQQQKEAEQRAEEEGPGS